MCLPVSRLFWVSSLAYPNLLGTKDYVVVVVVVEVSSINMKFSGMGNPFFTLQYIFTLLQYIFLITNEGFTKML
jgi:hypothetical protein